MVTSTFYSGLLFRDIRGIICLVFLCCTCVFHLEAQEFSKDLDFDDPSQIQVLETRRGDHFIGKVQSLEDQRLSFLIREENLLIFTISEIERLYPFKTEGEWEDFRPAYLSVFPTAYNLPKGAWEYQNNSVLWNTLYYGVSDHFSIGGGFIIPAFFTLRLKYTTELSEKFALGLQNQNLMGLISDEGNSLSTFTLTGTLGKPANFLNFGVGLLVPWEGAEDTVPVFSLGHGRRLGRRVGIHMVLNAIVVDGEPAFFPTGAFNYFGKNNRLSLGVSMETTNDFLGIFAIPVLSYNQRF
ncbi:MAG TPA: hypothetical protein VJ953_19355 [Saprospiraceae bacterium]|nr:hypothetical protein [Saprospiraceae bacterium]